MFSSSGSLSEHHPVQWLKNLQFKLNPLGLIAYIFATDVVPFSGFSLGSLVQQRTDNNAGNLLVLLLSETMVIRAG